MRDAFSPLDATGTCLLVLTLDRYGTYSGEEKWKTAQEAYRDLSRMTGEFLKRLRRWMKSQGWDVLQNQWVATVEAHRSGWPHVNLVLWSPELANWISTETAEKVADGLTAQDARFVSRQLADIVTGSGWGLISTAERARSAEESLGYICKTAGKVDESIGELAKLSQLPTNAPFRFRRIRSGKGFLPPRKSNPATTGTLVRRRLYEGTRMAEPLHSIVDPKLIALSAASCALEESIWIQESEVAARCPRQVRQWGMAAAELPPVTRWRGEVRLAAAITRERHTHNDYLFEPEVILLQSSA